MEMEIAATAKVFLIKNWNIWHNSHFTVSLYTGKCTYWEWSYPPTNVQNRSSNKDTRIKNWSINEGGFCKLDTFNCYIMFTLKVFKFLHFSGNWSHEEENYHQENYHQENQWNTKDTRLHRNNIKEEGFCKLQNFDFFFCISKIMLTLKLFRH